MAFTVAALTMTVGAAHITFGYLCFKPLDSRPRSTDSDGATDIEFFTVWVAVVEVQAPVVGFATIYARRFRFPDDLLDFFPHLAQVSGYGSLTFHRGNLFQRVLKFPEQ